ncbi:MAG: M23 family metallopeptidase [Actinobacteria bacterium]|nr:M23 family metallopeptidase [Actinomycetota bacterium]
MKLRTGSILVAMVIVGSCGGTESTTPALGDAGCSAGYPEQATSRYVLPYSPGSEFMVGQGNCTDGSHEIDTSQAYAYDIDMPIGTPVIASRDGIVVVVVENWSENNDTPGQENYLIIEHDDGSIAGYYHLTEAGIDVEEGDQVFQGDSVARSGNTGDSSGPHLHFEVATCEDCDTLPVNFGNTREHQFGLDEDDAYLAE